MNNPALSRIVRAKHVEFSLKRIGDKKTVFSSRVANVDTYQVMDPATNVISILGGK